jgi:hypothetical protein
MLDNPIVRFLLELLRAIVVDALSGHVRRQLISWFGATRALDSRRRAFLRIHFQNRDRLLHKLRTAQQADS